MGLKGAVRGRPKGREAVLHDRADTLTFPRRIALAKLTEELGIPDTDVSQRLRRAHAATVRACSAWRGGAIGPTADRKTPGASQSSRGDTP